MAEYHQESQWVWVLILSILFYVNILHKTYLCKSMHSRNNSNDNKTITTTVMTITTRITKITAT